MTTTKKATPKKKGVKTGTKKRAKNGRSLKVKRVASDSNPLSMASIAAGLGYSELAKKLTIEKPKPFLSDVTKRNGGTFRRYEEKDIVKDENEFVKRFSDMSEEDFAAWILGNEAADKIEKAEDVIAKLTKEYWQAKRRLICAKQVLNAAYDKLEKDGTLITVNDISKTEARNVVARVLEEELFAGKKL